jgi:hypothetical protein
LARQARPGHTQVLLTYNKKNAQIRHSGLVFVARGIDQVYHILKFEYDSRLSPG